MEEAFEEALVSDYDDFLGVAHGLPDKNDEHVLAAALKTRADVLVTENLKDFPAAFLEHRGMEVRSSDEFIADTIALDANGLAQVVNVLRSHSLSL